MANNSIILDEETSRLVKAWKKHDVQKIQVRIDFEDFEDWEAFRIRLTQVHGHVQFENRYFRGWSMINWKVPSERFMRYPLGRIWPDSILVELTLDDAPVR